MSSNAKVFRILITAPSDVERERLLIEDALLTWNSINSGPANVVLLPILWERAVVPRSGNRPQAIINRQIVDDCDALIGVFWTRLGTPTGVADSGSEEEINHALAAGKPVSLYFSNALTRPNIDLEQKRKLDLFKKEHRSRGIIQEFSSPEDLATRFAHHINALGRELAGDSAPVLLDVGHPQYPGMVLQAVTANGIGWGYPALHSMVPETPARK